MIFFSVNVTKILDHLNIQKKLAQGKGKYYVRFAKNFNTKQVAKAVLYLNSMTFEVMMIWRKM